MIRYSDLSRNYRQHSSRPCKRTAHYRCKKICGSVDRAAGGTGVCRSVLTVTVSGLIGLRVAEICGLM